MNQVKAASSLVVGETYWVSTNYYVGPAEFTGTWNNHGMFAKKPLVDFKTPIAFRNSSGRMTSSLSICQSLIDIKEIE